MDDETQGRVEHGAVIEIQDDSIGIEFLNIMPVDVARVAIGILQVVHEIGMDEVMKQMYEYCFEKAMYAEWVSCCNRAWASSYVCNYFSGAGRPSCENIRIVRT
jgi:hypothetical protein